MTLYFLRLISSSATGFSPYQIIHCWKPTSPIHLLYDGWTNSVLGEVDIADWVAENYEIDQIRDKAVLQ